MSQGFAITFDIPFHREDVWRELHAPQPLGMHSAVRVKTWQPAAMHEQGSAVAGGTSSDQQLISEGALRQVRHGDQRMLSRLVCASDDAVGSFQIWEVLDQEGSQFTLVGGTSGRLPRTSVYLADVFATSGGTSGGVTIGPPTGTAVTLGFDYARLDDPQADWWQRQWWSAGQAAAARERDFHACFEGVGEHWRRGMLVRGHEPIDQVEVEQLWAASCSASASAAHEVMVPPIDLLAGGVAPSAPAEDGAKLQTLLEA